MINTAKWLGQEFTVYTPDTTWNALAGVYIFCGSNQQNQWVPLYVGRAHSFAQRIPGHERWAEAVRLGATHIHAMVERREANREAIERQLIQTYRPRLNEHHS